MSLVADLAYETEIAASKKVVQTHMKAGWKHKERGAKAWEETQKIKADTQEVKRDTASIHHEIALEVKAIAQTDLSYTRSMGVLKKQGQDLQYKIKNLKVNGGSGSSAGDSFRSAAANNIKSSPRIPVEV
ncbi:hypothetical protein QT972_00345 [Microcoleus sp. herbarium7]|uniref:hypothetical protein n=1 Tax=Microcoleus sp. herbarium7 TaxID=3055435 RepID=UPI002FD2DCE0